MSEYKLKTGKTGEKIVGAYKKIENKFVDTFLEKNDKSDGYTMKTGRIGEKVVDGYKNVEDGVVGAYKKVEDGFVGAYKKIENKFVNTFLEEVEEKPVNKGSTKAQPNAYNYESTEDIAKKSHEFGTEIDEKYNSNK